MAVYRPPARSTKRRKTFVPGRDRVGGYYGRYAGKEGELKFFDSTTSATVSGSGATVNSLNQIPQGVTEQERVGRKCTVKSIWWRYTIVLPEQDAVATPADGDVVRTIIYLDKQANGAAATVTDILESANWKQFRNLANQMRFQVLMDRNHDINYMGMASDGAGIVSQSQVILGFTWYHKCNIPIEFSSTTGVIGEIRSNNIGILLISANGVATLASNVRLRFSDN